MRALWQRHGARAGSAGIGVEDDDIRLIAEELSGLDLERFFAEAIYGTAELDLRRLLQPFGIRLQRTAGSTTPSLGARTGNDGKEVVTLSTVYRDGPAQSAGLSAGDILMAIDGLRVTPSTLEGLLARRKPGEEARIHAFRRDELMTFTVRLGTPVEDRHKLHLQRKDCPLKRGWLDG
jgi:predicted metalloprotease with PDZ domain